MTTTSISLSLADDAVDSLRRWIYTSLTAVAFWGAILLPVLYLPLLASGLKTTTGLIALVEFFGIHILALLAGHNYQSPSE